MPKHWSAALAAVALLVFATVPALAHAGHWGGDKPFWAWLGVSAGGLFIMASFAPLLSLISKRVLASGAGESTKADVKRLNDTLRPFLTPIHYYGNIAAVTLAIIHWSFAWCEPISLQRYAIWLVLGWVILGVLVKFKLLPPPKRPKAFKLHTTALWPVLIFAVVVIGHRLT